MVYAPMGKTFSNSDWDIIDLLKVIIDNGEVDAQLLVREQCWKLDGQAGARVAQIILKTVFKKY